MAITLTINSVSRDAGYLVPGSERIRRTVKARSTASFTLRSDAATVLLTDADIGKPVSLSDGSLTFTGTIDSIRTRLLFSHSTSKIEYEVSCQDTNPFDRRVVSRRYPAGSIWKNIVIDIVTNFLDGEGITTTNVDGFGMIMDALEFDYRTVRECFNQLTDISGEEWWCIGSDLYFKATGSARPSAAFNLTDSSANWTDLEVRYDRSTDYRNRQFLRTKVRTRVGAISETLTGDGVLFFFPTSFTLTSAPTVTINGSAQTVYQVDVDAAGQNGWYWFLGGGGIYHGQSTPPANGATIVITYNGYDSSVIMVQDEDAITARAAVEGGSGKWDMLDEARDVDNEDTARQIATGLLQRRGTLPKTITYRTKTSGLVPGVKQNINITKFGLNADYYITDIDSSTVEASRTTNFFWHKVTLSVLLDRSNWTKWWLDWWSRTKSGRIDSGLGGDTSAGGGNNSSSWYHETPIGTINGVNTSFTLTYTPVQPEIALLFLNGVLQTQIGINSSPPTADYTLSGNTITYTDAPRNSSPSDWHEIWYLRGPGSSSNLAARYFSAETDLLDWGDLTGAGAPLRITGDLSIGMWIKLPSNAQGALIRCGSPGLLDATTAWPYYMSVVGSSGAWDIQVGHDSATTNYNNVFNANIPNDTWTYLGLSRNSTTKTAYLYTGTLAAVSLVGTWTFAENPPSTAGTGGAFPHCTVSMADYATPPGLINLVATVQQHYVAAAAWTEAQHTAAMNGTPPSSGLKLACPMGDSPEQDASSSALSGTVTGTTLVAGH